MLSIVIPGDDGWDPEKEEFVKLSQPVTLKLEHSLLSLSKWESKWHKPFLSDTPKTPDEMLDYVKCMTVTKNISPDVYKRLTRENMKAINEYMEDPATATKIYDMRDKPGKKNTKAPEWAKKKHVQTAETIYAAMFECGIPLEFEKRHINQLMTQIRVCQERMNPSDKMSKRDQREWQRMQNAKRKKKLGTKG